VVIFLLFDILFGISFHDVAKTLKHLREESFCKEAWEKLVIRKAFECLWM
jgi:hypothetical protein